MIKRIALAATFVAALAVTGLGVSSTADAGDCGYRRVYHHRHVPRVSYYYGYAPRYSAYYGVGYAPGYSAYYAAPYPTYGGVSLSIGF